MAKFSFKEPSKVAHEIAVILIMAFIWISAIVVYIAIIKLAIWIIMHL